MNRSEAQRLRWASYSKKKRQEISESMSRGALRRVADGNHPGWEAAIESNKGKPKPTSEETKAKISKSLTGNKLSEETRKKMSESHKKLWAELTPEQLEIRKRNMSAGVAKRPPGKTWDTKPEQRVKEILDSHGLSYRRQVEISGYSVDFLIDECVALEVNGCYWHACPVCGKQDSQPQSRKEWDKKKMKDLESSIWGTFIVWEHDIEELNEFLSFYKSERNGEEFVGSPDYKW